MDKKILIAVDGSIYSRQAIEYAVGMATIIKDLNYILLNVHPKISEFLLEDARTDTRASRALNAIKKRNHENSIRILDETKKIMLQMGVEENRIETVSQRQFEGVAKTILNYAKLSLCNAVVLGKRGLSAIEASFIGSITNSVLEHTNFIPVWTVSGKVKPSKIMLAIDGSENSLRAVDHICFMFEDNREIEITLLHVTPRLKDYCAIEFGEESDYIEDVISRGDRQCVESFYIHARKIFKEAGFNENRIIIKEVPSLINISKAIVEEAKKGEFSTIVVGTKGIDGSFFVGSVARQVVLNANNSAVWIVP